MKKPGVSGRLTGPLLMVEFINRTPHALEETWRGQIFRLGGFATILISDRRVGVADLQRIHLIHTELYLIKKLRFLLYLTTVIWLNCCKLVIPSSLSKTFIK